MPRPVRHFGYKAPGTDSARAIGNATWLLVGMRSLDGVTAANLAHICHLKLATAERLLADERARRG